MPTVFEAVQINWAAISPMLLVIAGGLIGVVVEAFVPRGRRHVVQVALSVLAVVAAFVALVTLTVDNQVKTLGGSVVVDGMTVFLQGTLLVFGLLGILTMAEKFGGDRPDAFTPMGAAIPGSDYEAAADRALSLIHI